METTPEAGVPKASSQAAPPPSNSPVRPNQFIDDELLRGVSEYLIVFTRVMFQAVLIPLKPLGSVHLS